MGMIAERSDGAAGIADRGAVEAYLNALFGGGVRGVEIRPLGGPPGTAAAAAEGGKGYGYGVPLLVRWAVEGGPGVRQAVLSTMSPGPYGHEHMADRAQAQLWSGKAFNALPRHARALDVGAVEEGSGRLVSLGRAEELFLLHEYVEGRGYFEDLVRLRDSGAPTELDERRARALCDYLVEIHRRRGPDPGTGLYRRRLRELLGHGECILGLTDNAPDDHPLLTPALLSAIEGRCLAWRWRLRGEGQRLCQVHGDFHPWNILFRDGTDFTVLDRSRGEWGEAADDVTCLGLNYLFFALQAGAGADGAPARGPLVDLFRRFFARYLEQTGDSGLLAAAPPFFAFRGLVMASPVWYPALDERVRRQLVGFLLYVLDSPGFDPRTDPLEPAAWEAALRGVGGGGPAPGPGAGPTRGGAP